MDHDQKQGAYASDITYDANNGFGFDYPRDSMMYDTSQRVQRPLNYVIIDEVDSTLVDKTRTPLITSGQVEDHTDLYRRMSSTLARLTRQTDEERLDDAGVERSGGYYVDEKSHRVYLTESGHKRAEHILL